MLDETSFLPPGLHDWTMEEAEERLVHAFPESRTRPRIWDGYRRLQRELLAIIRECERNPGPGRPEPGSRFGLQESDD